MYIEFISAVVERLHESADETAVERADLVLAHDDLIGGRIEHARGHGGVAVFAAEVTRQIDGAVVVGESAHERFDHRVGLEGLHDVFLALDLPRQIARCPVEGNGEAEDALEDADLVLATESFGEEEVAVVFELGRSVVFVRVDVFAAVRVDVWLGHGSSRRRSWLWFRLFFRSLKEVSEDHHGSTSSSISRMKKATMSTMKIHSTLECLVFVEGKKQTQDRKRKQLLIFNN